VYHNPTSQPAVTIILFSTHFSVPFTSVVLTQFSLPWGGHAFGTSSRVQIKIPHHSHKCFIPSLQKANVQEFLRVLDFDSRTHVFYLKVPCVIVKIDICNINHVEFLADLIFTYLHSGFRNLPYFHSGFRNLPYFHDGFMDMTQLLEWHSLLQICSAMDS